MDHGVFIKRRGISADFSDLFSVDAVIQLIKISKLLQYVDVLKYRYLTA